MAKDYSVLDELTPKTVELHRAIFDEGYNQGFDIGYNQGFNDGGYKCGLDDAWECARKLYQFDPRTNKQLCEDVFEYINYNEMICNCLPEEAIKRLKEYEEKQKVKQKDECKIKVGDEVESQCYGKGFVTRVCNDTCAITWLDSGANGVVHLNSLRKTGNFNSVIAELFKNGMQDCN